MCGKYYNVYILYLCRYSIFYADHVMYNNIIGSILPLDFLVGAY